MSSKSKKSEKETDKNIKKIGDYSIDTDDIYLAFDAELDAKGLVDHHISSANELYEIGIPQIITQVFEINLRLTDVRRNTEEEKNIDHVLVKINFTDVVIDKPTMQNYFNSGKEEILYPNMALLKEKTYKSNLRVGLKIKTTAVMKNGHEVVREDTIKNFKICKIPILVGSKWCNTYKLPKEALIKLNHDPSDPGGYFVVRGVNLLLAPGIRNNSLVSNEARHPNCWNILQTFNTAVYKQLYMQHQVSNLEDGNNVKVQIISSKDSFCFIKQKEKCSTTKCLSVFDKISNA